MKKIITKIVGAKITILKLLIGFQIFVLVSMFAWVIVKKNFFLVHEDEIIYYNSARLFAETNSIQSSDCITEDVSKIGRCNWYGPCYNIFYGSFAKLFGISGTFFFAIHFFLIALSVLLIYRLPILLFQKLLITFCFLSSPVVVPYMFTYFPESIHIFSSVLLAFCLVQINLNYEKQEKQYYQYLFIFLVMFFMLFRSSTIFWMIGLLPFSKNRNDFIKYGLIFLICFAISLLYMKCFYAPAFGGSMKSIKLLFDGELLMFIKDTYKQFVFSVVYLLSMENTNVFILLLLVVITIINAIKNGSRLLLSASLISCVVLLVLMTYYTVSPFFFIKQTSFLMPLLIIVNIIEESMLRYFVVILSFVIMPIALYSAKHNIYVRQNGYKAMNDNAEFISSLSNIKNYIEPNRKNIILWSYNEYDLKTEPSVGNQMEAFIPLSTINGYPILYTSNITSPDSPSNIKFRRYGKLKIDYVLSKNLLTENDFKLIYANKFFNLYSVVQ